MLSGGVVVPLLFLFAERSGRSGALKVTKYRARLLLSLSVPLFALLYPVPAKDADDEEEKLLLGNWGKLFPLATRANESTSRSLRSSSSSKS